VESRINADVRHRASQVRVILLDVDGVLTDGRIIMGSDGKEARAFFVRDGMGIRVGQMSGLTFGLVSGRESPVVTARAAELGITELHQGIRHKAECFREILARNDLTPETVCYMGDDVIDVPALRLAGLSVAPADAAPEAREAAHYVTERRGGRGAVRELVDLVLRAQGLWDGVIERCFRD
jgi:3-deoxy-D-manno-octulosonate 8-phosphate phosphatase (KDO 8-P phosphatase)